MVVRIVRDRGVEIGEVLATFSPVRFVDEYEASV